MYTTTSNSSTHPEFFISINKNRIKHYNQDEKIITFLNNLSEFELEFNNKTNENWLCKILMNGKSISDIGLVLQPNSHDYLERFFDKKNKFKFETFEIDDVSETKAALQQNGLIEVQFYKERIININPYYNVSYTYTNFNTDFNNKNSEFRINSEQEYYCSDIPRRSTLPIENISCQTLNSTSGYSANSNYISSEKVKKVKTVETGRVEEGKHSNQNFQQVYKQWEAVPFYRKTIQILPFSRKGFTAKEINTTRQYCNECGVKVTNKDNFCYKCGNKL